MEFYVYETRELVRAGQRPLVIITSTTRRSCPTPSCRCFFHYIKFPDADTMQRIVDVHYPGIKRELVTAALQSFYDMRNLPGLKKKPSTSELIDWLKLLMAEDIPPGRCTARTRGGHPAAARRAAEERAGCAPVRAHGVHEPRQPLTRAARGRRPSRHGR